MGQLLVWLFLRPFKRPFGRFLKSQWGTLPFKKWLRKGGIEGMTRDEKGEKGW